MVAPIPDIRVWAGCPYVNMVRYGTVRVRGAAI